MLLAALFAAVLQTAAPSIADVDWIAGYWLSCGEGGEVSETWTDARSGMMVAHSVTISRRSRADFEMFRIAPHEGGLAYFAQPRGRPAVIFPAVEIDADHVVFQNLQHDFPQRIIYRRNADGGLTTRIEGPAESGEQAMEWHYRKAELNAHCPA